jgi:hypothetical protein
VSAWLHNHITDICISTLNVQSLTKQCQLDCTITLLISAFQHCMCKVWRNSVQIRNLCNIFVMKLGAEYVLKVTVIIQFEKLSSRLLLKTTVRIYRMKILHFFCMDVEHGLLFWGKIYRRIMWSWKYLNVRRMNYVKNLDRSLIVCSPGIVRRVKSRKVRWAEHVAKMEETRTLVGMSWKTVTWKTEK